MMTIKQSAALKFLIAIAAAASNRLRRLWKRLTGPGPGPFLADV
jgi:hypothetical protein